jgi:hypothetical protein
MEEKAKYPLITPNLLMCSLLYERGGMRDLFHYLFRHIDHNDLQLCPQRENMLQIYIFSDVECIINKAPITNNVNDEWLADILVLLKDESSLLNFKESWERGTLTYLCNGGSIAPPFDWDNPDANDVPESIPDPSAQVIESFFADRSLAARIQVHDSYQAVLVEFC